MNVNTLFYQALATPLADRAAFLDRVCAGNAELRAAVEARLKTADEEERLFDRPPLEERLHDQPVASTIPANLSSRRRNVVPLLLGACLLVLLALLAAVPLSVWFMVSAWREHDEQEAARRAAQEEPSRPPTEPVRPPDVTPTQPNPIVTPTNPNVAPTQPHTKPVLLKAPFTETEAQAAQVAWAKYLGRKVEEEVDLGGGMKLVLVLIPPGTFTMGSPLDEKQRNPYEKKFDSEKQHAVTITKPFYLGKYSVTQEQYEKVVGKNPSYFKANGGGKNMLKGLDTAQFPVDMVSWDDAEAFCERAKKVAWGQLVLPSEAQWEYACRAGTETPFHFGNENNGNQSNCYGDFPYGTEKKGPYLGRTREVGAYTANGFGLDQMHGNVWQWCADYYGPYEGLSEEDPARLNKDKDNRRALRGGSWSSHCWNCRVSVRLRLNPDFRNNDIGFRVCILLN